MVNANGSDAMYVVLVVYGKSAEIVDWGYETVGQLLESWNNVEFKNLGEFV